jgi:phosphate transport system substrate-binding protein
MARRLLCPPRSPKGVVCALVAASLASAGLAGLAGVARAPAAWASPTVNGTGSSFAAPALLQWQANDRAYGVNVNYVPTSSVTGLQQFAQSQVDFGASEIGYSTGQSPVTPSHPYQYLPDVSGGIALAYNLSDSSGHKVTSLRLDPQAVASIFTAHTTYWDDPHIQALNPGLGLPHTPIRVVYRSDAAGENYILSYYLDYLFPSQWESYVKAITGQSGPQALWPVPQSGGVPGYDFSHWVGEQGSDAASTYVSQASNDGSITYVEDAWAVLDNLPVVYLLNPSGSFVPPFAINVAVALEKAILYPDLEEDLRPVFTNPLPESYPLSSYSYLVTSEGTTPPDKGAVLGQFIQYLACAGQGAVRPLNYAPIPPNLVQEDFDAIRRINGAAPPPPINASTCKNPYIDGELPLPGEPTILGGGPGASSTSTTLGPGGVALPSAAAVAAAANGGFATQAALQAEQQRLHHLKAVHDALAAALTGGGPSVLSGPVAAMVGASLGLLALVSLPPVGGVVLRGRHPLGWLARRLRASVGLKGVR